MQKFERYEPKKCWVGEGQKICYATREEAELVARVAEYDHGISGLGFVWGGKVVCEAFRNVFRGSGPCEVPRGEAEISV